MKRIALSVVIFSLFLTLGFSQAKLAYAGDSSYKMVERTNLRRYVNGKYVGLTSHEVHSFISRSFAPEGVRSLRSDRWYDGNFFVQEETLRNSVATMAGIHEAIPSVFKISADGKMTMFEDNGYPTFRSFPTYTTQQLKEGDSWKGEGERAVDPMNKGIFTRIPILVLYTFAGSETYKGENVYRIKAIWQTNYLFSNFNADPKGDSTLQKALGGHKADIIVRASTGEAILISDNVDESFFYADGTKVDLKGTITMFTEYPPAIDHDKLIFALNRIAKADTTHSATTSEKNPKATGAGSGNKIASSKGIAGSQNSDWGEKVPGVGSQNSANGQKSKTKDGGIQPAGKNTNVGSSKFAQGDKTRGSGDQNSLSGQKRGGENGEIGSAGKNTNVGGSKFAQGDKTSGSGEQNSLSGQKRGDEKGKNGSANKNAAKWNEKLAKADKTTQDSSSADASSGDKNNMVFEETPAGIRLSVRDIKFKADSAEVLPGEKSRLDEIAEVLKLAPNSQFLIEGHTASVGKPAGEQKLSEERAKNIAAELAKRGIPAANFICKGHGGNKPIASNSTNEGRAQNRRVEITILE
jgi:outer membrane protein OmpA-like peptidoglycan-associated protein